MDFFLTEEQQALQNMAAEFAEQRLMPGASEWDEKKIFPISVLKEAAALGMAGMIANTDIGGSGLTRLEAVLVFEQLAQGCVSTAAYLSIHNMVTTLVDRYASSDLRQHYGPLLTQMTYLASYCLTEPNAGSDAAALQTKAEKKGDGYVLNGSKAFISGGGQSDVYACMVRTGELNHRGITCLLIEKNTPGLSFGIPEHKMGWNAQPTTMIYFENCRVPFSQRIGEEGQGFNLALSALNGGRVNIAACSLGGALACLKLTQNYLQERKQFDQKLMEMQALRFNFADMLTHFEAAQLMVYRAASALDTQQKDTPYWCAMAKRFATDCAFNISDMALQLHGGYGYLHSYQIERIFRDLRVHRILEGTNEIMREIIAKSALDRKEIAWLN